MLDALSAAVGLMSNGIQQMGIISQNLANVSTTGFRREISVARPFTDVLAAAGPEGASVGYATSVPMLDTVQDVRPGTLRTTSNPLDFAIEGDGFFEVSTGAGPRYTRQGNFRLDSLGRLVSEAGAPVMGASGEILLNSSQVSVDSQGRILENQKQVGQLRLVRFANPRAMVNSGAGLYAAGASTPDAAGAGSVRQGFLEGSNVNSTREMVRMIETVRLFEAGQKIVQAYDEMLDRSLSKLGEF
jgi:flagellar basal-body rod protein FlgF